MAKIDSLIHFSGTLQGLTRVRSKSYKDHVRAARKKGTPVNAAFRQSGKEMVRANVPAKLIKDALDPYRGDFKCGRFWSRLVSLFKGQIKQKGRIDFQVLEGMELSAEYPLTRFVRCRQIELRHSTRDLRITITHEPPQFKKKLSYLDGYRLSLLCLYLHKKEDKVRAIHLFNGPLKPIGGADLADETVSFSVPMVPNTGSIIFCLIGEGSENGRLLSAPNTKGIQIVKVWKLGKRQGQTTKGKKQTAKSKAANRKRQ